MNIHRKDWCWSWSSNTFSTWCEELTHWKRPWCWERLRAGGEGDDRGWDGWIASLTQWTWVWANFRDNEGQGSLVCYSPQSGKASDMTEQLNNNDNYCESGILSISGRHSLWISVFYLFVEHIWMLTLLLQKCTVLLIHHCVFIQTNLQCSS